MLPPGLSVSKIAPVVKHRLTNRQSPVGLFPVDDAQLSVTAGPADRVRQLLGQRPGIVVDDDDPVQL